MLGGVVSTVIGTFIDVINGEDAIDAFSENLVKGFVSAGVTTAIIGAASVKFVIAGGWVIALGVVVGLLVNAAYENNWFYLKDIADGIGSIIHAVKDGLDAFVDEMNAHYTKGMELWNDAYQTISEDQELMELAESMGVDLSPKIPVAQTSTKYGDTTSTYNDVFI